MSHYPIFADLNRRAVLLAGAGQVAERKAESLLHAGAALRVVAAELNPRFQGWLQQGRIEWLGPDFQTAFLNDVFLVVAATDDEALNRRIFQAAEKQGKLCNTVDNQALCSFIVPAVIDRSPIQIAVSSGGASPVLARLWRQKIEALIPAHTGKMAALAGAWRARVKAGIKGLSNRRRFWEQLFASRFDTLVAQGNEAAAEAEFARQLAGYRPQQGEVVLVGAGPGDAGLLTLHALQAMQAADVVLYDALVSDEILALVRKDADKKSAWASAPVRIMCNRKKPTACCCIMHNKASAWYGSRAVIRLCLGAAAKRRRRWRRPRCRFASCRASPPRWAPPLTRAYRSPTAIMRKPRSLSPAIAAPTAMVCNGKRWRAANKRW